MIKQNLIPLARDIVLDHIPQLVIVLDANDVVIDVNNTVEEWTGLSKTDMLGKDPMDVFKQWPQLINRLLVTEETREEVYLPGDPERVVELVVVPMLDKANGALLGRTIVAHDITEQKKLEEDLTGISDVLWQKIAESDSLREQLQQQAIRDPLTGLYNRRFFNEALESEVAQSKRNHQTLSIIILDIDFFKKFNDTYGHKCGDFVLQTFAKFLLENIRSGDILCRFGGEEFVILMPNAEIESAYERAEFLRKQFEGNTYKYEDKKINCTFSAGVAAFPAQGDSGEVVLNLADQALYQSKANGRNKVSIYTEN
jgi:diguanylate cyclase (GGDEF)-like protein/PAS domain S-box-containing protein